MHIYRNVSLSEITYYRIGGIAGLVVEASSPSDVHRSLLFLRQQRITPILPLGLGSNMLLGDHRFPGAVLWLTPSHRTPVCQDDETVRVYAGDTLAGVLDVMFTHHRTGLAWAAGLPSTIGGAIRGNAGAFGSEIGDRVIAVDSVDLHEPVPVIRTLDRAQCAFGYRSSVFKQARNLLITSATLSLPLADENTLREQREIARRNTDFRTLRHPLSYPSCGSVFKNIVAREMVERVLTVWPDIRADVERSWHGKIPMAYVIRRLGLAGYKAGNAQISEKHANFISNLGQAKAGDVESLIAVVVERVHATFAFEPELEVEIAGSGVRGY